MQRATYPLTNGQKVIGQSGQLFPNTPLNNIGGLLLLEDDLDFDLLQKTIKLCIARNDALRLRLIKDNSDMDMIQQYLYNMVRQYVTDEPIRDIPFVDFSSKTQQEMDDEILRWNSKPINVFEEPLCEFVMVKSHDGRQGVFSKIDHMATDAWMSAMLGAEMIEVYYALKRGEELPPPAYPFVDFIAAEQAYMESPRFRDDEAFWLSLYEQAPPKTFLHESNEYHMSQTGKTSRKSALLDAELTTAIQEFCRTYSLSPANFFETVLAIYLYQLRGSQDVVLGSTALLRSTLREKRTCGPLVNNLNIRFSLDENKSFREVCEDTNLQRLGMVRHMHYPQLNFTLNIFTKHNAFCFYDCLMGYHIGRMQTREKVKSQALWYSSGYFAIPLFINVTDIDDAGRYLLYYEYQTEVFSQQRIDEVHNSLIFLLQKGIEKPDTIISRL